MTKKHLKPCRILVVDDNPAILELVRNLLSPLDYQLLTASSGENALQITQSCKDKIDLLLTDVVMPEMDGPKLAAEFKRKHPEAKVIFMSGYMRPGITDAEIRNREKAFVAKPFTLKILQSKMKELLR